MNIEFCKILTNLEGTLKLRIFSLVMLQINYPDDDRAGIACGHIKVRRGRWVHIYFHKLPKVQEAVTQETF